MQFAQLVCGDRKRVATSGLPILIATCLLNNILAWPYETVCACYLCEMSIVRIYSGKGVRVMSDDVAARDIRHFERSNKSITCHLFPTKRGELLTTTKL